VPFLDHDESAPAPRTWGPEDSDLSW
jgi:hypothetical protein